MLAGAAAARSRFRGIARSLLYLARMHDTLRICVRTGCRWPAVASLSYRYATRQAWLLDLSPSPDPAFYDLCPHHADALTVPRGWERVDDRSIQPVVVEASARDRAEQAAARRRDGEEVAAAALANGAGNRYARLAAELPRLAAELAGATPPPPAVPSRDLAPLPQGAWTTPTPAGALDGQLAMPVDEAGDDDSAVVVPFELASARRRVPQV